MEIPTDKLDEFKCTQCGNYLKRSPVYLKHDGAALCSDCFTPEIPATRDRYYESAAQMLRFPCKYHEYGCTSSLPFVGETEEISHEEDCYFRQYVCPVLHSNGCDWMGSKINLLTHCREQHSDYVVKNPITLTHDICRSSARTYLLVVFNLLFLLHTKICVGTGKIFHAVCFLGSSKKAEEFSFVVDIKRGNISLSRNGKVTSQACLTMKESITMSLNINSLLGILNGFEGTTFTISLKREEKIAVQCGECEKDVIFFNYLSSKG